MAKKKKNGNGGGEVGIDPDLPLLAGNSVSFYTAAPEDAGKTTVQITDARGTTYANVSPGGNGDLRISKIIEEASEYKIEFFNDGESFASGEFSTPMPAGEDAED